MFIIFGHIQMPTFHDCSHVMYQWPVGLILFKFDISSLHHASAPIKQIRTLYVGLPTASSQIIKFTQKWKKMKRLNFSLNPFTSQHSYYAHVAVIIVLYISQNQLTYFLHEKSCSPKKKKKKLMGLVFESWSLKWHCSLLFCFNF